IATSSACARSSRPSTRNSHRSKPSMASVTDTANAETTAPRTQSPEPQSPDPGAAGAEGEWSSDGEARSAVRIEARPDGARRREMMRRLVEPTRTRAGLVDKAGVLAADRRLLRGPGDAVQVTELPPAEGNGLLSRPADQIYDWIANLLPARHQHPEYREGQTA